MECNKDDALRAKELAEKKLFERDLGSAKIFAKKAQDMYPNLDGLPQLLATIEVYVSAEKKVNGELDWYRVLGIQPTADDQTIRRRYRKLALTLHPDKNKSVGADGAFNLISQAWSLLSDNAKRIMYDKKRNFSGVYQASPGGKPSVPACQNGFFSNFNTANWKDRGQRSAVHPNQTKGPPVSTTQTFWTMCRSCRTKFEYNAQYVNCTLSCINCRQPFIALEASPPPVYRNASSTLGISQMNQNNINSTRIEANYHVSGRIPMPAANSSLGSGPLFMPGGISSVMSSFSTAAEAPGVFRMPCDTLKRAREDSTPVMKEEAYFGNTQAAERTGAVDSTFRSSCFGSNSILKRDGSRKKCRTDECKVNGDGRYMQNNIASQNEGIANEFGSHKDNSETGRMSAAGNYRRNGIWDVPQQQMKKLLTEKARKEIQKKLDEWNAASKSRNLDKSKNTNTEVIEKDKEKAIDDLKPDKKKAIDVVKPGAQEIVDSDTIGKKCFSADSVVADSTISMSVPDPDFHDFDRDRIENTFGKNQVWAVYDEDDGMPRYYALIHDVISKRPFKMTISWLNSKTNDELAPIKWVNSGFPKTSGDFRIGKRAAYSTLNSFSHKVQWTKGLRGAVHIYPKKESVWALYRNWSANWNEFTEDEVIHKYEMVEVLEDYNEEQGVNVAPLVKVPGFKTVFRRSKDPRRIRNIPKAEMFRLSHQVPAYLLTGQEGHNAPRGCLELDPAAIPMELLQVVAEVPEQEPIQPAKKSMKDECRNKENSEEDGLVKISQTTKQGQFVEDIPRKEVAEAIGKKNSKPEILYVYRRRHLKEKRAL